MNATIDVKRTDLLKINPADINVNEGLNARKFGHTPSGIKILADSIARYGQKQPVSIRNIGNGQYELVTGYGRHSAVTLINNDSDLRELANLGDSEFLRLEAKPTRANDTQVFVDSIIENAHRNETSPVDDAHNIKRLIEEYGFSWDQVADIYPFDVAWAKRIYKKILVLSENLQKLVHSRQLPIGVAMSLSEIPEEQRAEVVKSATDESGNVKSSTVTSAIRDSKQNNGRGLRRSLVELRNIFQGIKDGELYDDATKKFADDMLNFIAGTIGEQGLINAINRLK